MILVNSLLLFVKLTSSENHIVLIKKQYFSVLNITMFLLLCKLSVGDYLVFQISHLLSQHPALKGCFVGSK